MVHSAQGTFVLIKDIKLKINKVCVNLEIDIRSAKKVLHFHVNEVLSAHCIVGVYFMRIEGLIGMFLR